MNTFIAVALGIISGFLLAYYGAPGWSFIIAGLIVGLYAKDDEKDDDEKDKEG